jgi:hypothetical protein
MQIPDETRPAIEAALFAGRKIEAIKQIRAATGLGLKEARDMADLLEKELRAASPEKFSATKGGCASTILIALLLLVSATRAWRMLA